MATTEEECKAIVHAVEKNNVILCVGHVLRYTPYTKKIKELVDSGAIGKLINIQHLEPVGMYFSI
jgi:predicted dehydrogenase